MSLPLRVAAIVLFVLGGIVYVGGLGNLTNPDAAGLVAFGLAAWCGAGLVR